MRQIIQWVLLASMALTWAPSITAQGQTPQQRRSQAGRVPVTIALVDSIAQSTAPFVLVRRADVGPNDVILLRTGADAQQLSAAINALLVARQASGDRPVTTGTFRVRPRQNVRTARRVLPWVPRVLADLRRASRQSIPGVGSYPAVVIWLPRQQTRR
jgi:hypothetical protein